MKNVLTRMVFLLPAVVAIAAGCVSGDGSGVTVVGEGMEGTDAFSRKGILDAASGDSGVSMGGRNISNRADPGESISDTSSVKIGDDVTERPQVQEHVTASDSFVNAGSGARFAGSEKLHVDSGNSHVTVMREELKKSGHVARRAVASPGKCSICVYPPRMDGDVEIAQVRMMAYVEFLRLLDNRGYKIAARDGAAALRPENFEGLLRHLMIEGLDIGYKLSLLDKAVPAGPADLVVEILDVDADTARSEYRVVVRIRSPYNGCGQACAGSRSFQSISRESVKRAAEELFGSADFSEALAGK